MYSAQRALLIVGCVLCCVLLKHLWHNRQVRSAWYPANGPATVPPEGQNASKAGLPNVSSDDRCYDTSGIQDVVLVLKTGSTEIYEKLPIHFATTFTCLDLLVYSDLHQVFGNVEVRDALSYI